MGFDEIIPIWRRRLKLTIALIILAAAGFAVALEWFPATYQAQASVVLLASRSQARLTGHNPYLSFSPSLSLAADVVSRAAMAQETAADLARRGFTDGYTVEPPAYTTTTTGSVLVVTVTGHDAPGVERTLRAVVGVVGTSLGHLQHRLKPWNRIRLAVLALSPGASLAMSATARPLVMTAVAGLLAAFGIPVLVDGSRRRRALRSIPVPAASEDAGRGADSWTGAGVR